MISVEIDGDAVEVEGYAVVVIADIAAAASEGAVFDHGHEEHDDIGGYRRSELRSDYFSLKLWLQEQGGQ